MIPCHISRSRPLLCGSLLTGNFYLHSPTWRSSSARDQQKRKKVEKKNANKTHTRRAEWICHDAMLILFSSHRKKCVPRVPELWAGDAMSSLLLCGTQFACEHINNGTAHSIPSLRYTFHPCVAYMWYLAPAIKYHENHECDRTCARRAPECHGLLHFFYFSLALIHIMICVAGAQTHCVICSWNEWQRAQNSLR